MLGGEKELLMEGPTGRPLQIWGCQGEAVLCACRAVMGCARDTRKKTLRLGRGLREGSW